jgi:hypothetical protein
LRQTHMHMRKAFALQRCIVRTDVVNSLI